MKGWKGVVCVGTVAMMAVTPGSSLAETEALPAGWKADPKEVNRWKKSKRPGVNCDETRVPEYQLPELLEDTAGRSVESKEHWMRNRPALLKAFEEHVYGSRPETEYEVVYKEMERREDLYGIGGTARRVRAVVTARGDSRSFDFVLVTPDLDRPAPLIVHINNRELPGLDKVADKPDGFWPVERIIKAGHSTAAVFTSSVDPDAGDGYQTGVRSLLDDPASDPDARWGCLSAWGWGASRVLDYALEQPGIDPERTAVVGHSRAGKSALWAAAVDPRFAVAYGNNSGCGGSALFRRVFGETVTPITDNFAHWFCPRFRNYRGKDGELPVDQHQLIALIAPRATYVASADRDLWADPRGEYGGLIGAAPVYELFGMSTITSKSMPPLDTPRFVGPTGYHIRSGRHNLTTGDWMHFLAFLETVF